MDNLSIGNIDGDAISTAIKEMTDKFNEDGKPSLDELREVICVGKSPIQLLNDRVKELNLLINVILTHLPDEQREAILKTFHQSLSANYMKMVSHNQTKH